MQQLLQTWWKDLKNFFHCKYLRLQGKLTYPHSILPKTNYKSLIDIDELHSHQELVVLRRSSKSKEDSFNSVGVLRNDIINERDIAGLSMNLMGSFFKEQYIKFAPTNNTKAVEKWPGLTKVHLSDFLTLYKTLPVVSPIYYSVSDLHNISIPYIKPNTKDIKDLLNNMNAKFEISGSNLVASGKILVTHEPTYLNYWHVELHLINLNSDPVERVKNNTHKVLANYIFEHILSVKGSYSYSKPVTAINSSFYKLNRA